MRAVIQRVSRAAVVIEGATHARIGEGLLVLVAVQRGDTAATMSLAAEKILNLRIFAADPGRDERMDRSLADTGGEVLAVSQFTLAGSIRKGRRPSFDGAAQPEVAEPLYNAFVSALRERGGRVATGVFRAMMQVELVNAGPVTFILELGSEEQPD